MNYRGFQVSVILPTFNERENIGPLIEAILEVVPFSTEILVVDDNSPDGTWEVVETLRQKFPQVCLLRRLHKRGLSSAIADGIAASRGEVVVWMDCDFSMPPEDVPRLLIALGEAEVAVASRYAPGGWDRRQSSLRSLASWALNCLATMVLEGSLRVKDYTSGFVAVRRAVLERVALDRGATYGEYFITFLYQALRSGFRVVEVPYENRPRRFGETKTAPNLPQFFRLGWVYLVTIFKLKLATALQGWELG